MLHEKIQHFKAYSDAHFGYNVEVRISHKTVEVDASKEMAVIKAIFTASAERFNLTHDDLIAKDRHRHNTDARNIAVLLALELRPKVTLSDIARYLKRHHSTIIYIRDEYKRSLQIKGLQNDYDKVRKQIELQLLNNNY